MQPRTREHQPQKLMEVGMDEPASSISQLATSVATTAETMVATPKTRSVVSSAVPKSAAPAYSIALSLDELGIASPCPPSTDPQSASMGANHPKP